MAAAKPRSDLFRSIISVVVAFVVAAGVYALVANVGGVSIEGTLPALVTVYILTYPPYTAIYVGWGLRAYRRMSSERLHRTGDEEGRAERSPLQRSFGSGATTSTVSTAIVAVVTTIGIAQTPELREQHLYVVGGMLTVASAWVLMVFAFAQAYLRLASTPSAAAPISFRYTDEPGFGDYLTLAVLVSTMAATISARMSTRDAWKVVRANVVLAFAFNTIILAMTVSLLFGAFGR